MKKKPYITYLPLKTSSEVLPFITSPYGDRILNGKTQFHQGVDMIVSSGKNHLTSIINCCFKDAVIIFAGHLGNAGNTIILLDSNNSTKEQRVLACYAHLGKIYDHVGDIVSGNEPIGYMGGTGTSKNQYAPHLHFSLNILNKDVHITKAVSGYGSLDPIKHGLNKFKFAKS